MFELLQKILKKYQKTFKKTLDIPYNVRYNKDTTKGNKPHKRKEETTMSRVWYGNLTNRLEENKMFCEEIKVGTGVTEYYYSDRRAYEVVEVKDQKHVSIRQYDHKAAGEAMSNDWELISNETNPVIEIVKRGNGWYRTKVATIEHVNSENPEVRRWVALSGFDVEKIRKNGKQTKFDKMNISFGRADYYYDYEF